MAEKELSPKEKAAKTRKENAEAKEAHNQKKVIDAAVKAAVAACTVIISKYSNANEGASERLAQPEGKLISDLSYHEPIQKIAANDLIDQAELAAFMEDYLVIRVHTNNMEGEIPVISVCVNGTNQNIIRGRDQMVKRKYVEVLARTRTTGFEQETQDASKPENIQMLPTVSLTYPFAVVRDDHKMGKAWLDSVLEQY